MIAIASDHGGYHLKEHIKAYLAAKGITCEDFGTGSTESCAESLSQSRSISIVTHRGDHAGETHQFFNIDFRGLSVIFPDFPCDGDQLSQKYGVYFLSTHTAFPQHHFDTDGSAADKRADLLADQAFHPAEFRGQRAAHFKLFPVDA